MAWGVAGGGVSLILLLVISMAIILVVRRMESVMRSHVDVLQMQIKTVAGEHKGGMYCTQCVCACVCVFFVCLFDVCACTFFLPRCECVIV